MTLLDEAMAAVTSGEVVGIVTVGEIYCRLLGACERAADISRAEQWMAVAADYVVWGDFVPPTCRLHYGGILIATGRWGEAEEELLAAIRTFDGGYRSMRRLPLLRLAELRVLQGRFEEAECLLEGNESHAVARRYGRRSRWRAATSSWPRSSRRSALKRRIHPMPPARRCWSCSSTCNSPARTEAPQRRHVIGSSSLRESPETAA